MRELLRVVPAIQRSLVQRKAVWLAADVRSWARPAHAHLGHALYDNLALAAAATAPTVRRQRLAALVRFAAWVYLLDDRLDAPAVSVPEIHAIRTAIEAVVAGRQPATTDYLECGLAGVLADLRRCDYDGHVMDLFGDALIDGVRAAAEHAEQSRLVKAGRRELPPVEEYLDVASRHICYRSLALGLVLLVDEKPSSAALARLDQALVPASRAVRLANDLRTAPKDAAEGTLNVVQLRTRGGAVVTTADVVRWIKDEARTHLSMLRGATGHDLVLTAQTLVSSIHIALAAFRIADLKGEHSRPPFRKLAHSA